MPKTSTAPTTAAEARRVADQLERAEKAESARRSTARKQAEWTAAEAVLAHADGTLNSARDQALANWHAAAEAEVLDVGELFSAWVELRRATSERAATIATASSVMGQLRPRRHETSGQPIAWRNDVHDPYVTATFSDVLDTVVRDHVQRHTERTITAANQTIRDSGTAAAGA